MDLQAIEARLEAASPGPWKAQPFEDEGSPIVGSGHEVGLVAYALRSGAVCDKWYDKPQCEADSEFIAHAPEDIRALLDAVKAVREVVARHPDVLECSEYGEDEPISCGWKSAYRDVVWALGVTE